MKRIIYLILFLMNGCGAAMAQDAAPASPVTVSPNFTWYYKIVAGDTLFYGYSNGRWTQLSRAAWVKKYYVPQANIATDYATTNNTLIPTTLATANLLYTLKIKQQARVITTTNIALSGSFTYNTVAIVPDNYVLVNGQTDSTQNGLWISQSGAWIRANDSNTGGNISGSLVPIGGEDPTHGNTIWINNQSSVTIGATNITYSQIGGSGTYTASNGITLSSGQFSADTALLQTALNFFPKGDTRYEKVSNKVTSLSASAITYPSSGIVKSVTDSLKTYTKSITVGTAGTYTDLQTMFNTEPAGKTLITLTDKLYTITNPKLVVKEGWILQGQGMGRTEVRMLWTTTPISIDSSTLQVRVNCTINDIKFTSVTNTTLGAINDYAIHSDKTGAFTANINRCWFRSTTNPANQPDNSGWIGTPIGVGLWEGQNVNFNDCIIESTGVTLNNKTGSNLHNTFVTTQHLLPSTLTFRNCQLSGGFTTLLITDSYSDDAEPDTTRVKDLFQFIGCNVTGGIYLRSAFQTGGSYLTHRAQR
jgi:hypothetical protein